MAHWNEVAVTAVGEGMLNDLLSGRRLTVLSAYGGTGETDPAELAALTDVAGERRRLELLDVENGLEGKTVKVQVSNEGVTEGYSGGHHHRGRVGEDVVCYLQKRPAG